MKRFLIVTMLLGGTLSPGFAQTPALQGLIENSPFVPEGYNDTPPPPPTPPPTRVSPEARTLEFRGLYTLNDSTFVNIFDLRTQKGEWFTPDDPKAPFQIMNLDENAPTVTLDINGEPILLAMKKASESPLPVLTGQPSQPPAQNVPNRLPRFGQQAQNNQQRDAPRPVLRRRIVPRDSDGNPIQEPTNPADRAPPPRTVEELMETMREQSNNNR